MFRFRRPPGLPASELLIALAVACGLGCGENVLVTSWELSLKASDAGANEETADGNDAGVRNNQAINAQDARVSAHKDANKDKEPDKDDHDEKSGH
jgi:hypothetical protein